MRSSYGRGAPRNVPAYNRVRGLSALATIGGGANLKDTMRQVYLNGREFSALLDTGASMNYIMAEVVDKLGLTLNYNQTARVTLADLSDTEALGTVLIDVAIKGVPNSGSRQEFFVLENCPKNILLGIPFCKAFNSIRLPFCGKLPTFNVVPEHSKGKKRASCSLSSTLEVGAPMLCRHLVGPNLPIKLDGKKYSVDEKFFIAAEVDRMLKQGLIRKSHSSW